MSGMVDRPAEFTVPELINALPSYTIPVTLVCAGGYLCSATFQLLPDGADSCCGVVHDADAFMMQPKSSSCSGDQHPSALPLAPVPIM